MNKIKKPFFITPLTSDLLSEQTGWKLFEIDDITHTYIWNRTTIEGDELWYATPFNKEPETGSGFKYRMDAIKQINNPDYQLPFKQE